MHRGLGPKGRGRHQSRAIQKRCRWLRVSAATASDLACKVFFGFQLSDHLQEKHLVHVSWYEESLES